MRSVMCAHKVMFVECLIRRQLLLPKADHKKSKGVLYDVSLVHDHNIYHF